MLFFRKRLGGITGDTLGATQQIAWLALLLAFAVFRGGSPLGVGAASVQGALCYRPGRRVMDVSDVNQETKTASVKGSRYEAGTVPLL